MQKLFVNTTVAEFVIILMHFKETNIKYSVKYLKQNIGKDRLCRNIKKMQEYGLYLNYAATFRA